MRAEHFVSLPTKDGSTIGATVKCTIKRPTLNLKRDLQKSANRLSFVTRQRATLNESSNTLIAQLAIAEVAAEHAPADKADAMNKELADLRDANEAIIAKIDAKDGEQTDLMIDQLKMIVNVPKGDAETAPEIAWGEIDTDTVQEALGFFLSGVKPSAPTPSA